MNKIDNRGCFNVIQYHNISENMQVIPEAIPQL